MAQHDCQPAQKYLGPDTCSSLPSAAGPYNTQLQVLWCDRKKELFLPLVGWTNIVNLHKETTRAHEAPFGTETFENVEHLQNVMSKNNCINQPRCHLVNISYWVQKLYLRVLA